MTTIKTSKNRPLEGKASNGRPVKFSLSSWCWYYTDTKGTDAVEKVNGQVYVTR